MRVFRDRAEAGRRLGRRVRTEVGDDRDGVVVLGLPRGGVPVAFEVAHALSAPLDVIVVRKLGAPFQPDLALGAVGEDGTLVLNDAVLRAVGVSSEDLGAIERRERAEVARRCELLRGGKTAVALVGCTVVIVDDGIATGATARAACMVARARGASRVMVAVPVGPPGSAQLFGPDADALVCLEEPRGMVAVGQAYWDFRQVSDAEVSDLLVRAGQW
jgi:predicted phosphoribosyltransferase